MSYLPDSLALSARRSAQPDAAVADAIAPQLIARGAA